MRSSFTFKCYHDSLRYCRYGYWQYWLTNHQMHISSCRCLSHSGHLWFVYTTIRDIRLVKYIYVQQLINKIAGITKVGKSFVSLPKIMKCGLMIDTWHCLSSFRCQIETGKSVETMTTFIEVNTLAGIMMSYRCFVQSLINNLVVAC